jgi:xeroderma pigmentosum group C-complementing protein
VKHGENITSNLLKGKRRKLETKAQINDSKSAENAKKNPIPNVQPKLESSDSSSDEFVYPPHLSSFDLDRFPEKRELTSSDFTAIENSIFTGITRFSDSGDSDFGGDSEIKSIYSPLNHEENIMESTKTDRKKKTVNTNKSRIKSTGSLNIADDGVKILLAPDINKMDVSQLLALGESSGTISKVSTAVMDRAHDPTSDSDNLSDWEDVKGLDVKPTEHNIPKEGIEVTLEMPDLYRKRKKKGFDMEAHLRRRLNRMKREFQVLIHKVHLLCWIAHGRYVNSVLNSEVLMAQSLSLIPSQHCYPAKNTNLSYLEQIVEWFRKTVTVADRIESESLLPLCESLQQSFQSRIAHSARNLVFMFICILRALGVKARLMMSLQPLPLKPSSEDLCGINKTRKGKQSDLEEGTGVKVERSDTRDTSEATTSKKSLKEENKYLKDKKSESASKLQDENRKGDNHKNNNKKSGNSNLKSKTQDLKKHRNYADISEEKMQKLKRMLRTRKETVNMYREKSDSSDEDDASDQGRRVMACKEEQRQKMRISVDRHPHKRPAADLSVTDQWETLSKVKGSGRKTVGVNTKTKSSSQIASSHKQDENSDSDFVPEPLSDQKSCNFKTAESGDSNSESDFESRKVMQKKKVTNRKTEDRGVLVSDSGTTTAGKGTQKKNRCDVWSEVFLEEEEKWISVDVQSGKLHCVAELHVSHLISAFAHYVAQCRILNIMYI